MRVLTVTQPHASLIVAGEKGIETRGWGTKYRGTIGIHSSKSWPAELQTWDPRSPVGRALRRADLFGHALPLGRILGTATLIDCVEIDSKFRVPRAERGLGDFTSGRFAWVLSNAQPFAHPIPARGWLYLWTWDGAGEPLQLELV